MRRRVVYYYTVDEKRSSYILYLKLESTLLLKSELLKPHAMQLWPINSLLPSYRHYSGTNKTGTILLRKQYYESATAPEHISK